MSSATKSAPQFRVGDWVSFLYGTRRLLVQIIEDRGPIGVHGQRLYRVRFDQGDDDEPTTSEVPEDDLEPAPEIMSAKVARKTGFSTQNWPRLEFDVVYNRQKKTNHWTATTKRRSWLAPGKAKGAVAYGTARWESEKRGHENHATVSVFLEFDPRLLEPHATVPPDVGRAMIEEARELADETFKAHHHRAVIEHIGDDGFE